MEIFKNSTQIYRVILKNIYKKAGIKWNTLDSFSSLKES